MLEVIRPEWTDETIHEGLIILKDNLSCLDGNVTFRSDFRVSVRGHLLPRYFSF